MGALCIQEKMCLHGVTIKLEKYKHISETG